MDLGSPPEVKYWKPPVINKKRSTRPPRTRIKGMREETMPPKVILPFWEKRVASNPEG